MGDRVILHCDLDNFLPRWSVPSDPNCAMCRWQSAAVRATGTE